MKISYNGMKEIIDTIDYLKSLNPASFEEVAQIQNLFVYDEGIDYCDFTCGTGNSGLIVEGSFCRDENGTITLSPSFSVYDENGEFIFEEIY